MIKERLALKMVSHLLSDPTDHGCETLDEVIRFMDLVDEEVKIYFIQFIEAIQWMDLVSWYKHYVQLIDFKGSTNLYMTNALLKEPKKQQSKLLSIQKLYAQEGFRFNDKSRPDYLPLMLDFACTTEEPRIGFDLLNQHLEPIERITAHLDSTHNFYVNLFKVISRTLEQVESIRKESLLLKSHH